MNPTTHKNIDDRRDTVLNSNQLSTMSISKTTTADAVSPMSPALQACTIRNPSHIYMEQTDEGARSCRMSTEKMLRTWRFCIGSFTQTKQPEETDS